MILTRVQVDGVTTIDAIEMVDEGDVEAERVVAMSTSLETQGSSEVVGAAAAWGYSSRSAPCSIQQTRCTYIGGRISRHAIK